jgi:hypothetical protein
MRRWLVRRGYFEIPDLGSDSMHGPHHARVAAFTVVLQASLNVY